MPARLSRSRTRAGVPLLALSLMVLAIVSIFSEHGPMVTSDDRTIPVASIGGRGIPKADFSDFFFRRYPDQYRRTLDELIDEHIVRAAAAQTGLRVPAEKLAAAVSAEVEARRDVLRDVYGKGESLDAWVQRGYGVDVETWKRTILGPRFESLLLRQRAARLENRRDLRLRARLIVTSSAAKADQIMRKLRAGADFSLTALKQSEDATKGLGGSLPPIGRGDLADFPIVEQKLFATPAGQLLGPLRVQVDGRPQWQIYKIVRRDEPWSMTGQALLDALEEDIERVSVSRAEFDVWRARVRHTNGVRYFTPTGRDWHPPR